MSDETITAREAVDRILIEALAVGACHADAASAAKVSAKTVQRRMELPEFRAQVEARRRAYIDQVTGALALQATQATQATAVLAEALTEWPLQYRLRAANIILQKVIAYRKHDDLALEISEFLAAARDEDHK